MKNQNNFSYYQVILVTLVSFIGLAALLLNLSSCQSNLAQSRTHFYSLLSEQKFSEAVTEYKDKQNLENDPVINLLTSVAAFFDGNYTLMNQCRGKAFSSKNDELKNFFTELTPDKKGESAIMQFLKGIYLVSSGDKPSGVKLINSSATTFTDSTLKHLADYTFITLTDTTDFMLQNIFYTKYSGLMKLNPVNQEWVPDSSAFKLSEGKLTTLFGHKYKFVAQITGWDYLYPSKSKDLLGYYLKVTNGEIVIFNSWDYSKNKADSNLIIDVKCDYSIKPFDYFNKCRFIKLDKANHFYPLLDIPYYKFETGEIGGMSLLADSCKLPNDFFVSKNAPIAFFGQQGLRKDIESAERYGRTVNEEK